MINNTNKKNKRGKWLKNEPSVFRICSNCLNEGYAHYNYCPWCGSKNIASDGIAPAAEEEDVQDD